MIRDDVLLLCYIAALAMNHSEMRKTIGHAYGRFGLDCAWRAIDQLSEQWKFEKPQRKWMRWDNLD